MKISTKLILISLVVSFVPIVTVILMAGETSLFHQEDFQGAITVGVVTAVCIGFVCPFLCMRWLFLTQLRRIKDLCANIKQGRYISFHLQNEPREKGDENEIASLMRDMNWMVNQIRIRESKLKNMLVKLENSEAALHESEMHYRRLVENMGDIIFTTDVKGNFKFIGKRAKDIIHYDPENMLSRNIREFLSLDSVSLFEDNFCRQILNETIHLYEVEFINNDGKHVPLEINTSPLLDTQGQIIGIEGIARDMSEHKRLEAELCQARKMEAIGTMTGGISHDFNNMLQTISGFTELLLISKDKSDPDYKKLIHIATQASRASELTSRLATFSRKVESHIQPLDLNREIENLKDILTRAIPKMINIEFHLSDKLEMIDADPTQIEQIIMNLAINARDAMPDSGKLLIKTQNVILNESNPDCPKAAAGRYVLITVSDTGAGMDKEVLKCIFDPFYTSKEVGKGTGLGLSIVHEIVGSHSGYINCVSVPGRGTAFKIYLPVSEAEMGNQGKGEEREKEIARGEESILMVDDEQGILVWGREILKNYGYNVATAENGEKAITKMRESISQSGNGFDLVILDLNMPVMGGYKCFQELVKIKPEIKVIIASGYSPNEQMIKKTPDLKDRAFIMKPYQMEAMLEMVREMLDKELS